MSNISEYANIGKVFYLGRDHLIYDPKGLHIVVAMERLLSDTNQDEIAVYLNTASYINDGRAVEPEIRELMKMDMLKEFGQSGGVVEFYEPQDLNAEKKYEEDRHWHWQYALKLIND